MQCILSLKLWLLLKYKLRMRSEELHVTSEIFMITVIFFETIPKPEFSLSTSQESGSKDCYTYVPPD